MTQAIVNAERLQAFDERMALAEYTHSQWAVSASAYYWALWEIKRDRLYLERYPEYDGGLKRWLHELSVETWGFSVAHYQEVFRDIVRWSSIKADDEFLKHLLGKRSMAISRDLNNAFTGETRTGFELKPEVKALIAKGGETETQWLTRVAELPPSEGRKEISALVRSEYIYCRKDTPIEYDERKGTMRGIQLVHEVDGKGIVSEVTLTITGVARVGKQPLPLELEQWLCRKLGLEVE